MTSRIAREIKTIEAMVALYCQKNHRPESGLCQECADKLEYAKTRLGKCPYKDTKPPCIECTIHCFKEPYKTQIREIMRFSGPRMMFHHPILGIAHLLDRFREK